MGMSRTTARAVARISAERVGVVIGGTAILDEVTLEVPPGQVLALVGPNGAGKSTLLGVLAGDTSPTTGTVTVDGHDIRLLPHRQRARLRSVLTQENAVSFPFLVRQVVEMGRSPWTESDAREDAAVVEEAAELADIRHLLHRRFTSLSGGEKARVSLARVLAQDTGVVFLDEPTAALDLRHQESVMRVARHLAETGRSVVVVLHDLSLTGAYADRVALIAAGRLTAAGPPWEVLTAPRIAEVYGLEVEVVDRGGRPLILPLRQPPGA